MSPDEKLVPPITGIDSSAAPEDLGKALLLATVTQSRWVIRTVERIRFVDRNVVRRRITRHFSLPPDEAARPLIADDSYCLLPIFALPKGEFISCDLRDETNRSIALAPIEERWSYSVQILREIAVQAGFRIDGSELEIDIADVVRTNRPQPARRALAQLNDNLRTAAASGVPGASDLLHGLVFEQMVKFLAGNHLVFHRVDLTPLSHSLSFQIDVRFPDRPGDFLETGRAIATANPQAKQPRVPTRGQRFLRSLGLTGQVYEHEFVLSVGSTHLDIEAAEGIAIGERELHLPGYPEPLRGKGTSSRRANFLAPRSLPQGHALAVMRLRPASGVMRGGGPLILILFAALATTVATQLPLAPQADGGPSRGAVATLLLLIPGLVSIIAARPSEHPLLTKVVRPMRYLTLAPVPLAAMGATIVIFDFPDWLLFAVAVIAWIAAGLLIAIAIGAYRGTLSSMHEKVDEALARVA